MNKFSKIFEEEDDDVELTDYQKILALNKRKIDPYYTDFDGCDGEDYSDFYEVGYDGITFTFHEGLEDYLRFFFKETYGEEAIARIIETSHLNKNKKDDVPFTPDKPKKSPSAIAGKYGQSYSTVRHLARLGMKQVTKEDVDLDEARKLEGTYSNKNGHESKVYKLSGEHNEGDPYHVKLFKNGKHHEPADYFTNDKDDAHSTAKAMVKEEVELEERTLTEPEAAEKERIVKGMKKGLQGFKQRYGERAKSVMYATATKLAKEDTVQEGENKQVKGGDPCWTGYQMVGMKNKGGKKVPNCVPEETQCDTPMNRTTKIAKSAFEAVKNRTKVK